MIRPTSGKGIKWDLEMDCSTHLVGVATWTSLNMLDLVIYINTNPPASIEVFDNLLTVTGKRTSALKAV